MVSDYCTDFLLRFGVVCTSTPNSLAIHIQKRSCSFPDSLGVTLAGMRIFKPNYRDQEKEIPFLSRRDGTIIARQLIAGAVENPRVPAGTVESLDFIPLQSSRWDWQFSSLVPSDESLGYYRESLRDNFGKFFFLKTIRSLRAG